MRVEKRLAIAALIMLIARTSHAAAYDVSGVVLHQCSCRYACPCMFENGPDNCALAAVYHLDKGRYDGIEVGGLSFISIDGAVSAHDGVACCAGGNKNRQTPPGVVYLDAKATLPQRKALMALLEAHGEWPGSGRPVRVVPITFAATAYGYAVTVPGLFQGETQECSAAKERRSR